MVKILYNDLFAQAVNWLIDNGKVKDQQELSAKSGITETTISRIMNNRVKKPSDETIKKLLNTFPGLFNPDYFRGRHLYMLMSEVIDAKMYVKEKEEKAKNIIDQSSVINAALAAKDETIASYQLRIEEKEKIISELEKRIKEKNDLIASLKNQVALLTSQLKSGYEYPFHPGVADYPKNNKNL